MENKMNDMENIVELIDENNELVSFRYLMTLDYDNREYIVLHLWMRDRRGRSCYSESRTK